VLSAKYIANIERPTLRYIADNGIIVPVYVPGLKILLMAWRKI